MRAQGAVEMRRVSPTRYKTSISGNPQFVRESTVNKARFVLRCQVSQRVERDCREPETKQKLPFMVIYRKQHSTGKVANYSNSWGLACLAHFACIWLAHELYTWPVAVGVDAILMQACSGSDLVLKSFLASLKRGCV